MAAPTNISFATATDLGTSLPVTITQRADDAGTTYTLWFSYTAQTGDTEISVFPFGDLVTYTPDVTFWLDASTQYLSNNAQNRPSQIPVTPGVTYGIKIHPNGGNPSPANLTLLVQLGPDDPLATGQIAINDSTDGYPVVVMNPSTAAPVSFHHPFAAGEGVQVLQSGIVCAIDAFTAITGPRLYDPDLTLRATPTMPNNGYVDNLGSNQRDTFWALNKASAAHSFAVSIDVDGNVGTPLDLGADSFIDVQPQADNSALYGIRGSEIRQITNPGGVVTTLVTVEAGYAFGANLLMLTDDTFVVASDKTGSATKVRRYNLAGVEQTGSPYVLAVNLDIERIFADPADPTYFWIWTQTSTTNSFTKITVSDGTTTTAGPWPKFIEGDYQPAASATPDAAFGADFSCVPWIIRAQTPTRTRYIRRLRQFQLPSSPDNHVMFCSRLELLLKAGIGLLPDGTGTPVAGEVPRVMMRVSTDGGQTWLPERAVSAGERGKWKTRVRWLRNPRYRNAVVQLYVDAPVDWQWVSFSGDFSEGTS